MSAIEAAITTHPAIATIMLAAFIAIMLVVRFAAHAIVTQTGYFGGVVTILIILAIAFWLED
jgi:anaerobic C4-dicarboxylate transporter